MNCQTFKLNLSFSCMGEQTNKHFFIKPEVIGLASGFYLQFISYV